MQLSQHLRERRPFNFYVYLVAMRLLREHYRNFVGPEGLAPYQYGATIPRSYLKVGLVALWTSRRTTQDSDTLYFVSLEGSDQRYV